MIKINDLTLPSPTGLFAVRDDRRGSTAVATNGALVRDFAGMKYQLSLSFAMLTDAQAAVLNRFAASGEAVQAELPLPGGESSIECLVTSLRMGLMSYDRETAVWRDVTLNLEEV